jgi:hypothetical protein
MSPGWLVGWLAGWLIGSLAGWLTSWLAGWLAGLVDVDDQAFDVELAPLADGRVQRVDVLSERVVQARHLDACLRACSLACWLSGWIGLLARLLAHSPD